jgi:hypothetical protein
VKETPIFFIVTLSREIINILRIPPAYKYNSVGNSLILVLVKSFTASMDKKARVCIIKTASESPTNFDKIPFEKIKRLISPPVNMFPI